MISIYIEQHCYLVCDIERADMLKVNNLHRPVLHLSIFISLLSESFAGHISRQQKGNFAINTQFRKQRDVGEIENSSSTQNYGDITSKKVSRGAP